MNDKGAVKDWVYYGRKYIFTASLFCRFFKEFIYNI